ncbi:MAG: conjugal transfer protein TraG N-terminal domain-containing protein, partial [Candidatus Aphodousia sp.]|nr:conjugal transfer protein TraG N-terminal domain-containing protein [Candidatus Aphodousia sp.]
MVFEFFAYWNSEQIRDLFEAVVALTSGSDYLGLLKSVMLLGFLSVITVCALRYRGLDAMSFIFAVLIFYTITLVPKVDMNIRDDRAGTVYVVQNVPLGIAFMAGTTSHVGHWLTQSFENVFTAVDAERFSRFGMVFPQRAVSALLAAGPVTPQGRLLVGDFNRYCVVPELVDYPEKIDALTQSGNLWQTITQAGWLNPARRTPDLDNNWIGCDEAVTVIESYL